MQKRNSSWPRDKIQSIQGAEEVLGDSVTHI